ncbi:hypothetical protein FI667_g7296, partial [Globisporangium splendens]
MAEAPVPDAASRRTTQQVVQNLLVLQHEAVKSLTREFYQQVEAFVAQTGVHPLTQEPLSATHTGVSTNGASDGAIQLRATNQSSMAPASLVSDVVVRLTKDTCDAQGCVRDTTQMSAFLQRARETAKTDEDRVQVLFILDLTLQRARHKHHHDADQATNSSSSSNSNSETGRAMTMFFEQTRGYDVFVDWFTDACSYHDEPKKRLTQLVLQVMLRNKPKLQFTRKDTIQKLRALQSFVYAKANKELVLQVLEKYREADSSLALTLHFSLLGTMEGFLDLLPATSATLGLSQKKRAWTRFFFHLNPAFSHVLEFFGDASMQVRKGKIDLRDAQVATTDELGGLLFTGDGDHRKAELSSKISMENSRRFVLRVSEDEGAADPLGTTRTQQPRCYKHHYLCAEIADDSEQVNAQMNRKYSQQWLQALRAAAVSTIPKAPPSDSRELSSQIAAFMDHMHLAACVSCRHVENKKSVFEVAVKAWILQRELVPSEDDEDDSESWQILEYACAWKVRKTTAQFREFDAQMRQFFRDELRDLPSVPSGDGVGLVMHLLQSTEEVAAAHQRRVTALNTYFQQLLRLPPFSAFGSDAGVMLDNFLDISAHLTSFRQLEKATSHSMQLRKRKIVSWSERANFERLYQMHLDAATQRSSQVPRARKSETRRGFENQHRHHRHHDSHQHHHRHCESSKPHVEEEHFPVSPTSVDSVRQPSLIEETQEHTETVQECIAKIGKKLIVEAFTTPSVLVDSMHPTRSSFHP